MSRHVTPESREQMPEELRICYEGAKHLRKVVEAHGLDLQVTLNTKDGANHLIVMTTPHTDEQERVAAARALQTFVWIAENAGLDYERALMDELEKLRLRKAAGATAQVVEAC